MEMRPWLERLLEDYDKVLLLPDEDIVWNRGLLDLFERRLLEKQLKGVVIAVSEVWAQCDRECITKGRMKEVLHLFQLYEFTDKLIVGSLRKPFGRCWKLLAEDSELNEEQLMKGIVCF